MNTTESSKKLNETAVLDSKEAASILKVHWKTLQKLARKGVVPAFRIGDLWRFRLSDLEHWVASAVNSCAPLVP